MNRANVWSLADLGDDRQLAVAIKKVPSCVNVSGWSYAGGRRRGVLHTADGNWIISEQNGLPAPILHYAVVQGSLACVLVALEHGASADTVVDGVTADSIADVLGSGWEDIADIIRTARRRQHDALGVLEEDETKGRKVIELRANESLKRLHESFSDGVVDVEVSIREGGQEKKYTVSIPRYVGYKTLLTKVENTVGVRVLLSFKTPPTYNPNSTLGRSSTASPSMSQEGSFASIDPEEAAWLAEKEQRERPKFLELKPKTTPMFLQQEKPKCIARPLGLMYTPSPSPALDSTTDSSKNLSVHRTRTPLLEAHRTPSPLPPGRHTDLAQKIVEINNSGLDPEKRMEKLMKLLHEEEAIREGRVGKNGKAKQTISREKLDQTLSRLYDRSLPNIKQRRESLEESTMHGLAKLSPHGRRSELNETEQAIVERLYASAENKTASIAKIEERVQEAVPKPKAISLGEEEIQAMGARLCTQSAEAKKKSIQEAEKRIYGDNERKVVTDMEAHLASVYSNAVAKKKESIDKIDKAHGDFRSRKSNKKMTKEAIKEMGDRLSRKT